MGMFGWSLPPGCGTLPGEEDGEPYKFEGTFGFDWVEAVYWNEGGKVFAILTNGSECDLGVYEGEDVLAAKKVAQDYFNEIRGIQEKTLDLLRTYRRPPHTPRTVEEFLADSGEPEGDFCWDDAEAGDGTPYYCSDCDTWHVTYSRIEISRKAGFVEVLYFTGDEDGNWDCDGGWSQADGDSVEDWDRFYRDCIDNDASGTHFWSWAEYHLWCIQNLKDPCNDFFRDYSTPLEHAKAALDYAGYLVPRLNKGE